ncbi:hypothetical protein Micbo1qcDRAFT_207188 [Microdochium bolleyi]|uniref:Uncharacterized protein n=1 Tax=Microdochium bolleyi TaxID=196109 RepID=A0A136IU10_9PEZI|nr:hypothetical protein Micbo1qcDRAFT_207188 [Microdochium bolleyi]
MESDTISPLPAAFRNGQIALAVVGMVSLVTSALLFLHITYKLIRLELRNRRLPQEEKKPAEAELTLDLGANHYHYTQKAGSERAASTTPGQDSVGTGGVADAAHNDEPARVESTIPQRPRQKHKAANPLLILIYNLILADVSLSATFAANIVWLREDMVNIEYATCRVQGWLVSFGCVISSAFLLTLALYTYAIVLNGWRPSSKSTIGVCLIIWAASIIVTCIGPLVSGKEHFYARQQLWCWIEGSNLGWRLSVYVPGFFCLCSTFALYMWTFWCLHTRRQSARMMPRSSDSSLTSGISRVLVGGSGDASSSKPDPRTRADSSAAITNTSASKNSQLARIATNNPMSSAARHSGTKLRPSGHHPAFLIYPLIYTFLASPLTLGSITPLEYSTLFMTVAATLLASLGFFNALLWASTIIFSHNDDLVDTGLQYFAFMRTPSDRQYGNMIWVQGGAARPEDDEAGGGGVVGGGEDGNRRTGSAKGKWFLLGRGRNGSDSEIPLRVQQPLAGQQQQHSRQPSRGGAGSSGVGLGIRLDVSTTVVVEDSKVLHA